MLLHGFDSNCLEWRAIQPLLKNHGFQSYAFDILGWGFTERHPEIQVWLCLQMCQHTLPHASSAW